MNNIHHLDPQQISFFFVIYFLQKIFFSCFSNITKDLRFIFLFEIFLGLHGKVKEKNCCIKQHFKKKIDCHEKVKTNLSVQMMQHSNEINCL